MKIFKPVFLFPIAVIGLLFGMAGGWIRLGHLVFPLPETAVHHGALMVGGFLGTLISLERAMVLKGRFWLLVPLLSGLSVPFFVAGWAILGSYILLGASVGLMVIMYFQILLNPTKYQYVMSFGAVCWMLGNFALVYSGFVPAVVPWWVGFILFTIVGERLELSRFLPTPKWAKRALSLFLVLFFVGLLIPFHNHGSWMMGAVVIGISFWLLQFDMSKITALKSSQFRYIGIGLRVGYLWLTLHGIILALMSAHRLHYDLYIHTFFLGFTFSMIWAHAPIILPMILGIKGNMYHPILWIGWWLFQLSLLLRIFSSILGLFEFRSIFGVANGYFILGQFVLMAILAFLARGKKSKPAKVEIPVQTKAVER